MAKALKVDREYLLPSAGLPHVGHDKDVLELVATGPRTARLRFNQEVDIEVGLEIMRLLKSAKEGGTEPQ